MIDSLKSKVGGKAVRKKDYIENREVSLVSGSKMATVDIFDDQLIVQWEEN